MFFHFPFSSYFSPSDRANCYHISMSILNFDQAMNQLEKLKNEDLVRVRRDGTFLWYSANNDALQELLGFLYAECCTRNRVVEPKQVTCCK